MRKLIAKTEEWDGSGIVKEIIETREGWRYIEFVEFEKAEDVDLTSKKFDFDKELAESVGVFENYSYITVDIEIDDGELEIGSGFHKPDGRVAEIFLSKEDLERLI